MLNQGGDIMRSSWILPSSVVVPRVVSLVSGTYDRNYNVNLREHIPKTQIKIMVWHQQLLTLLFFWKSLFPVILEVLLFAFLIFFQRVHLSGLLLLVLGSFFPQFFSKLHFGDEDLWWFLEGNFGRWVPTHMKRQHAKAAYQACWGISAGRMMDKSARNMDVCSNV